MKNKFTVALVALTMIVFSCSDDEKDNVWTSGSKTFTKVSDSDWTQAANQDKITKRTIFTRQNAAPIYNYQWFQDNLDRDATYCDLYYDFWDDTENCDAPPTYSATGGTQGIKWAILDDTGFDPAWADFTAFGELGKPDNFYSLHNIASIFRYLDSGYSFVSVEDDFYINLLDGSLNPTIRSGTDMPLLVGKRLGVWLVEENIYFELTFTQWGSNGDSNAISYTRTTK